MAPGTSSEVGDQTQAKQRAEEASQRVGRVVAQELGVLERRQLVDLAEDRACPDGAPRRPLGRAASATPAVSRETRMRSKSSTRKAHGRPGVT